MDRLRIGVIGLGWFGEIHCEAILGVPNLELAALCTRTPDRLKALAREVWGQEDLSRLPRHAGGCQSIDAVSIVTMWDQHVQPAVAALRAGSTCFWKSRWRRRWPNVARSWQPSQRPDHSDGRAYLPVQPPLRWPRGNRSGKIGKIVSMYARRNIPADWTPKILNKIGPILGDGVHDTDLMLWYTGEALRRTRRRSPSVASNTLTSAGLFIVSTGGATASGESLVLT